MKVQQVAIVNGRLLREGSCCVPPCKATSWCTLPFWTGLLAVGYSSGSLLLLASPPIPSFPAVGSGLSCGIKKAVQASVAAWLPRYGWESRKSCPPTTLLSRVRALSRLPCPHRTSPRCPWSCLMGIKWKTFLCHLPGTKAFPNSQVW